MTWGLWSPKGDLKPKDLSLSQGSVPRALLVAGRGEEGKCLPREPEGVGVQGALEPWPPDHPSLTPQGCLRGSCSWKGSQIRGVGVEE